MKSAFGIDHGEINKAALPGVTSAGKVVGHRRAIGHAIKLGSGSGGTRKLTPVSRVKNQYAIQGNKMANRMLNPNPRQQLLNGFAGLAT